MSTFFILFFFVTVNGKDVLIHKLYSSYEDCVEVANILIIENYPNIPVWECTPMKGNKA